MAATLTINNGQGAVHYPAEVYKGGVNNPFGLNAAATDATNHTRVAYTPDFGTTGDVVFTLTNGTFLTPSSGSYILLTTGGGSFGRASTSASGVVTGAVSGSTITFKGITLVQGQKYYLAVTNDTVGGGVINMATTNTATMTPITLSVAQGGVLNLATASFIDSANFWSFTTTSGGTTVGINGAAGVIDVNPPANRLLFVPNAGPPVTTTTSDQITGFWKSGTTAFVDKVYGQNVGTADVIGTNSYNPFSSITFALGVVDNSAITSVTFTYNGGAPQTLTYDATNKVYKATLTTAGQPTTGTGFTFTLTVNGTTILNTRSFTLTVTGVGQNGFNSTTWLNNVSAGGWGINGYQALCPYVNTNTAFGTQFILNNASTIPASVFFDVVSSTSATVAGNLTPFSNVQVPGKVTIPAKSSMLFTSDEIIAAMNLPVQENGAFLRNQFRVTVTAPTSLVTGIAIQADGGTSKRNEPLFPGRVTVDNAGNFTPGW